MIEQVNGRPIKGEKSFLNGVMAHKKKEKRQEYAKEDIDGNGILNNHILYKNLTQNK